MPLSEDPKKVASIIVSRAPNAENFAEMQENNEEFMHTVQTQEVKPKDGAFDERDLGPEENPVSTLDQAIREDNMEDAMRSLASIIQLMMKRFGKKD